MKRIKNAKICSLIILSLLLFGCTDSDYKFSDIDSTLGFGASTISLPGSSTDSIQLNDVLNIKGSDCIVTDDAGYYYFETKDDNITPSHPSVDKVNVAITSTSYDIDLFPTAPTKNKTYKTNTLSSSFSGELLAFQYKSGKIASICDMNYASIDTNQSGMKINVNFSDEVKNNISKFNTITITLPDFLDIKNITYNGKVYDQLTAQSITFNDIPTSRPFSFTIYLNGLDFKSPSSTLTYNTETGIQATGIVKLSGTFSIDTTIADISKYKLTGSLSESSFVITSATGKFNPSINFDNIGNVTLNSIPDFLTENDVVVDLYNPLINLKIISDLPIEGLITGTLISKNKSNNIIASVDVSQFKIAANATSNICICKREPESKVAGTEYILVPNLSDIIKTVPHTITFNVKAKGNGEKEGTINLGEKKDDGNYRYTIQPYYSVSAPLAFDEKAQIVYCDTLKDWNDDIKHIQFKDGGYLELSSNVENKMPTYLTVTAYGIDKDKKEIGSDELSIEIPTTIAASKNGVDAASTNLTIKITPKNNTVLKKIDGLIFRAKAVASDGSSIISGIPLNAYKQTLLLKEIKVTLHGGLIYDAN
jgi:hypothetical protein